MRALTLLFSLIVLLSSCATGSTLRTARVLEKGEVEVSGGLVGTHFGTVVPAVIAAYGVHENLEVEGRYEDEYIAFTPRLQLLRSETSIIDCLTFFELGYSDEGGLQWGPGIMIGRRWNFIEPYLSYRFRHYSSILDEQHYTKRFKEEYLGMSDAHYVKIGSRFYLPYFWTVAEHTPQWFVGVEVGPSIYNSGTLFEWAVNLGFDY